MRVLRAHFRKAKSQIKKRAKPKAKAKAEAEAEAKAKAKAKAKGADPVGQSFPEGPSTSLRYAQGERFVGGIGGRTNEALHITLTCFYVLLPAPCSLFPALCSLLFALPSLSLSWPRSGCVPSAGRDARGSTRGPCAAVRRGRQARRGIDRDVDSFSSGQESCRKARPRLTDLPGM
ncbi:MAG: hypothetical protein WAM90_09150, partial [Rhodanobacter sp.]